MGTPKDQLMSYGTGAALVVLFLLLAAWARKRVSDEKGLGRNAAYHGLVGIFLILSVWTLDVYLEQAIMMFNWPSIVTKTVDFSVPIVIAIIVLRQVFLLIDVVGDRQMKRGEDETSARIFAKVMKMISTLILLLILGDKFGFNLSGLLAFGGAGGIIIGLAAKDMLSNVFSGMMLFYDRQFDIGDWISSPDRNIEGTVLEVGWRQTKILTFDKRPLYVPNSLFSTISVENPGRMRNRRIKTSINLRYEDAGKVGAIVDDIHKMLQEDDAIDSTQTMLVNFNAFGPFSLEIMVYCFTKTTQWAVWLQAQQTVFLNIIDIVHKHGADFAYETQTLYLNPEGHGAGAPSAPIPSVATTVSGAGPVG